MKDATVTIAGSVEDQVMAIGNILIDTALSQGCAVYAWREDDPKGSRGKSYYHIRVSDTPAGMLFSQADVFVHTESSGQWAINILDDIDASRMERPQTDDRSEGRQIPERIFKNAELLGAISALIGLDFHTLVHHLAGHFDPINNDAISAVHEAATRGYAIAAGKSKNLPKHKFPVRKQRYIGFTGNDAIAMGAAFAGCRFIYSYFMTPSNRVITFLENQECEFGRFARQMETAIAPVYRAMGERIKKNKTKTAQRPGKLAWTAEELFLPCLADTPVVMVIGQRPGRNCSKRTRALEDDFLLGICARNSQTPPMVLRPQNAEDAFYKTILSFQLADMHHAPVIIFADPLLAESLFSIGEIDPRRQSLFAYLSDPAKVQYHVATGNILRTPGFEWNASAGLNKKDYLLRRQRFLKRSSVFLIKPIIFWR